MKWQKKWFRELNQANKLFWLYILDHCDLAGIWEVDFEQAEFYCGKLDEAEIRKIFEKQFEEIEEGRKWFIKDFIGFQYGNLVATNPLHFKVMSILESKGLGRGWVAPLSISKGKGISKRRISNIGDIQGEQGQSQAKQSNQGGAGHPGEVTEPVKQSKSKPYLIKTDLQRVMVAYKVVKGFEIEDREWDEGNFEIWSKYAKRLLNKLKTWELTVECIQELGKDLNKSGLSWTLAAIDRNASEWKLRRDKGHQ